MIEVSNVTASYDRKNIVLSDISLTMNPGEINGLIGKNSSGKTTLMRLMAGIAAPMKGKILCEGQDVFVNPTAKEKIAYLGATYEYPILATVKQLVATYEAVYKDFERKEYNKIAEALELPKNANVSSLSTGMKMRLTIALNMAREAPYFLMDEPTTGLDAVAQKQFYEMLVTKVEAENTSVLISSHELPQLERICDRIHLLHKKRILVQSDTDQFLQKFCKLEVVISKDGVTDVLKRMNVIHSEPCGNASRLIIQGDYQTIVKEMESSQLTKISRLPLELEELFIVINEEGYYENL